jgi:hypothetical protein
VWQQLDRTKASIFHVMGASELAATSQKPAGLNSGRAIRAFKEFESRRQINLQRSLERAACYVAEDTIRIQDSIAERLSEEGESHSVSVGGQSITSHDWRSIAVDRSKIRVRVMPAASLPRTFSGRLEELQEMLAAGAIDHTTFLRTLGASDFDSLTNELTAPEDNIRRRLDAVLDGQPYDKLAPAPYDDYQRARRLCVLAIQQAEVAGAPRERVDGLRRWLSDVNALEKRMAAKDAAAMPPPAPPMMPGAPGIPGVSPRGQMPIPPSPGQSPPGVPGSIPLPPFPA